MYLQTAMGQCDNRTTKASTLISWLRKMWTAPTCTQSRVQNEEEENPSTGPNLNPWNAEVVDTETCSELEEGGESTKPWMRKEGQSKQ